jgi:Ca2+-binding RTX toxin-like protein
MPKGHQVKASMKWRSVGALVLLLGATALWAAPAHAAVTCTFNSDTNILQINIADDDFASIDRQGQSIRLQTTEGGPAFTVSCSGGNATVDNTDEINITGSSGSNVFSIYTSSGLFAPGATNEPGSSDEIEIDVDLLGGSDNLFVTGGVFDQGANLRAGVGGINLDAGETTGKDADLGIENDPYIQVGGSFFESNIISGAGGAGTGAPFPDQLDIRGAAGADILTGGAGNDYLDGDERRDVLRGGAGFDQLLGGVGLDTVTYKGTSGADVDLATGNVDDDGMGSTDFLEEIENLTGSASRDKLRGSSSANTIIGGDGRDRLIGRADNDRLRGNKGNDELRGNAGDDDLEGGEGSRDLCRGGPGTDDVDSCEL